MKILVIEDERDLRRAVVKGLTQCGWAADAAGDGEEGLEFLAVNEYDLVILDLNLPRVDGMELLRTLREQDKQVRVLILSARTSIEDRVQGLDAGANDYLVKPFHFDELTARVRSLLRRTYIQNDVLLTCGGLALDTIRRKAWENGEPLELTRTELAILEVLMLRPDQPVSAEDMMEHIYDSEADLFSNAVKVHIHSLRKKLCKDRIQNIRGLGYLLKEGNLDDPDL